MIELTELASIFGNAAVLMPGNTKEGLEKAAQIVETEAKAEIGTYQDAAGPFAAWAPLAESTLAGKAAKGFGVPDPLRRTGDMRDSIKHNADDHEAYVGSNDKVAVFQELGTRNIPPRSFLGGALARKEHEVVDVLASHMIEGSLVSAAKTVTFVNRGSDGGQR